MPVSTDGTSVANEPYIHIGHYVRESGVVTVGTGQTEVAFACKFLKYVCPGDANVVPITGDDYILKVVYNSNDGTAGSANGWIYFKLSGAATAADKFNYVAVGQLA